MPSAASRRIRIALERALHAAALLALVWLAIRPERASPPASAGQGAASATRAVLASWTRAAPDTVVLAFDALPGPVFRDWLHALRAAGSTVRWADPARTSLAVATEPVIDPAGGSRILLASTAGGGAMLRDAAGPLDSISMQDGLSAVGAGALVGPLAVVAPGQRAVAAPAAGAGLRRVLVLGRAGWEAKFLIAALEERGWAVDARLVVSPTALVEQGSWARPDTARHALAIVLDSSAGAYASRLVSFVRDGGGLIVAGEASRIGGLAPILPARAATIVRPTATAARTDSLGERGAWYPLRDLRSDAVVLERLGAEPVALARRERSGRVLQVAYAETWRRRMAPADGSVRRHREWWSRAAAAAALRGSETVGETPGLDPAPWLATRLALGQPTAATLRPAPPLRDLGPMLVTLILLALLTSWASRRLRGAP